ncbi:unnamed protein product [Rotaria sp. Silwood2]|nr:unnamed protein product [Rotaria sp. Silwood2]CAF2575778.1 unnamed protein product [Rotaria sp. Silwood2]
MCLLFEFAFVEYIFRDFRDLDKLPVSGLGVTCPDESKQFVLHCNILINDGPYQGIMIHLILNIPEDYPLTGPTGNIAPGLEFNSRYHAHIHEDHSPGYTLSTALLQIVTFFADPDFRVNPSSKSIAHPRNMIKKFTCTTCGHSYANQNPAIAGYSEKKVR